MPNRRYFKCCCCGAGFISCLPQDPDRDLGYGKCERCLPDLAVDRYKYQHPADKFMSVDDALQHLKKTA